MSTAIRRSYARVPAYGQSTWLEPWSTAREHGRVAALLEREELLAALAAEATRGGRLVFVGGEAGVGKTALVRAFVAQAAPPRAARDRARTSQRPRRSARSRTSRRGRRALAECSPAEPTPRRVARALLDELAAARGRRPRGRPLGRRGDAGRAAGARQADRRHASARGRDVPGRRGRHRPSAARGARRARLCTRCRAAVTVPRLSLGAVRTLAGPLRRRRRRALRADGRERLLRHRGPGGRLGASAGDRPRRRAGPDRAARRGGAAPARRRRARSRQGGALRCSRRWHRTSSTSSTAALPPASSVTTGTRSRSATSWRGSRWKSSVPAGRRRRLHAALLQGSRPRRRRGAGPRAPRPPRRASG